MRNKYLLTKIPMEFCEQTHKDRYRPLIYIDEKPLPFKFAKMLKELEEEFIESASDTNS